MDEFLEQVEPVLSTHKQDVSQAFSKLINFLKVAVSNAETAGKTKNLSSTIITLALVFKPEINEVFIEKFLTLSFDHWKFIAVRDLEGLKSNVGVIFDFIPSQYVDEIISYLSDRDVISEDMLTGLWTTLHELCTSCIKYCHHRRGKQDGKYRFTFAPTVKVKDGVEYFQIHSF